MICTSLVFIIISAVYIHCRWRGHRLDKGHRLDNLPRQQL